MISNLWGFTCECSRETPCEVYVKIMCELVACEILDVLPWGLNTCESPCETPCEVYENMCEFKWGCTCESLCETPWEEYVKICVKGMTSRHTLFTHISLCKISHACEKCVKNVWKTCEKSVNIGHFSHVFYMVFHIHTPSSDKPHYYLSFYLCFPGKWLKDRTSKLRGKPEKNI